MWPTGYVAVSTATAWNDKDGEAISHQHAARLMLKIAHTATQQNQPQVTDPSQHQSGMCVCYFLGGVGFFTSLWLDNSLGLVIVSQTTTGRVRLCTGTVGPCRNVFTQCNHALSSTWTWWITQTTGSQCCQWFPVHSGKQLCIVSSS